MNNKNSFNHSNWLKNSDKLGLNILNSRGISMYLDKKGYINYRLSRNEPYISTKDYKSLENIFLNITDTHFDLSYFSAKRNSSYE